MNPNPTAPAVLHSPGFAHYNLAWSPFHTTRIAVASSANYGIVGNGRLHLASAFLNPSGVPDIKLDKLYVRVLHPFPSVKLNKFGWSATKRRTACTTWHGQRSMKTSLSLHLVMVPSNSGM